MPSGNPRLFYRPRSPFARSLERGTTVIRCSPPPTLEALERERGAYYGEVERRKNFLPLPAGGRRSAGRRQPMKAAVAPRPYVSKQPPAAPQVSASFDLNVIEPDDRGTARSFENEGCPTEHCPTLSFQGSGVSEADRDEAADEPEKGASPTIPEEEESPRIRVEWDEEENEWHGFEAVLRGYIDIAHALLRHFEETLTAKQLLTQGSLQCAEIVCNALQQIQVANPRLALLVERISIAIALLRKRRLLDERELAARGLLFNEMDSFSMTKPRPINAPMYAYQSKVVEHRQPERETNTSHERIRVLPSSVAEEVCGIQTLASTSGQPLHAGYLTASDEGVCEMTSVPVYLSRPSRRQPSDLNKLEIGAAVAVPPCKEVEKRKEVEKPYQESPQAVHRVERDGGPGRASTDFTALSQLEEARSSRTPQKSVPSRVPAVVPPDTHKPGGGLAARMCGPVVPSKTHFFAPSTAGPPLSQRPVSIRRLFGEFEGERPVRPLVLSETHVLSEKSSTPKDSDAYRAAEWEALSLIKCAVDLIQSGEGPEYVQKQFFRYSRLDDGGRALAMHELPEDMKSSQGKFLLLRYAIATVEAEYGDSPKAADPNLYLCDLIRMKAIILAKETHPRFAPSPQEASKRSKGDVTLQSTQEAHSLPERSPEERMARHLPLTILNLPVSGFKPAGTHGPDFAQASRAIQTEVFRPSSRHELIRTASSEPRDQQCLGEAHTAGVIEANALRTPAALTSLQLAGKPSMELQSRKSPGSSEKSEAVAVSASAEDSGQLSRASSLAASPHQSFQLAPRSTPPSGRSSQSFEGSSSMLLNPGVTSSETISSAALQQPPDSEEGGKVRRSLAKQMGSAAFLQRPASLAAEGFKLSMSSLRRDSTSGTFSSRVFEAPSNPTDLPTINAATSVGLKNLSASRTFAHSRLPDIPDSVQASEHSL
ncbi:hypothetical protein Efla_000853 [Eimeria flavescens]